MSVPAERSARSTRRKSELLSTTAAPQDQPDDSDSANESTDQHKRKSSTPEPKPAPLVAATPLVSPHQRQGDRGSSDDAVAPRLPSCVRYHDLRSAGIVSNWPQLYNLIDDCGFPEGVMLSPNTRAWRIEDIERWLASRPTERKKVVTSFGKQHEKEVA
jgi:Prophage CP4-57 regulatory protein (AlpA)